MPAATQEPTQADRLVREFEEVIGLTPVDAHRSAFCALAVSRGWTKARVGRYLGISRARVGQRIEKLQFYAESERGVPTLKAVMRLVATQSPNRGRNDDLVGFGVEDWQDLDLAKRLIDMVVRD